jgi:hypothetical protein
MEGLKENTLSDDTSSNDIVVSFAFSAVRLSGLTNMFAGDVSTFVMCVLALWQRSDLAKLLNDNEKFCTALFEWCEETERHSEWESGAAAMPYGRDFLEASKRWNTELQSESLKSYKAFWKHHDPDELEWATHLVEHAKLSCLKAAVFARDTAQVRKLANVFDDHVLMKTAAINGLVRP